MMGSCTGPLQQDMFQILEPMQISGSLYSTLHHEQKKYSTVESICVTRDILEGRVVRTCDKLVLPSHEYWTLLYYGGMCLWLIFRLGISS